MIFNDLLSILANNKLTMQHYDFPYFILNFLFLYRNITLSPTCCAYIFQLIEYTIIFSKYNLFVFYM